MKLILALLLPTLAHAFTLNNSIGARFKDEKVNVRVGINPTACTNVDLNEVASLVGEAVDEFWNKVPSSRLELKDGGSFQTGDDDFWNGELCLIGGTCGATVIPGVSDIVITCNQNATNFTAGSLLALTLPNVIRGKNIQGAVVIINDTSTTFDQLSRDKKVAVIAHELGHAIGLGHSEEKSALMYFAVVPKRSSLGQDDIDGVTYLYPVQLDVFGAGCFLGSIAASSDDDSQGPGTFWPTAIVGLVIALVLGRKSKKSIAESSLA